MVATTIRCYWVKSCYLPYDRCLATSSCSKKTVHRSTGHARQSSCCNGRRPHSSHLICGLRIASTNSLNRSQPSRLQDLGSDARSGLPEKSEGRARVERTTGWRLGWTAKNVIDDAIDQWRRHLHACVRAGWGHFEYLLWLHQLSGIWFVKFVDNLLICR